MYPFLKAGLSLLLLIAPGDPETDMQETYKDHRPADYANAMVWMHQQHNDFQEKCKAYCIDKHLAMAIVSPEVARYNAFFDAGEAHSNRMFYTQFGAEASDFSTGHFQMKPSFAEYLESKVCDHPEWATLQHITRYEGEQPKTIRAERLDRLESTTGQIDYLMAFIKVCEERWEKKAFASKTDQLEWYAMAYNKGLQATDEEISVWLDKAWFPNYGKGVNFPYPEVARSFYTDLKRELP